ncbi:MAG TPA: hypothetical protein VKA46_01090 [Gemmataceae bacterium]|nr:hypothetical protein [Gemmataceae bacterium]
MREWAKVLLDRAPFYAVTRPLAGAALGAVGGGLYGALCGGVFGALNGMVALAVPWALAAAAAGATAGFLMGACSALDRAACRLDSSAEPRPRPTAGPSSNGHAPRARGYVHRLSRAARLVTTAALLLSGWVAHGRGSARAR